MKKILLIIVLITGLLIGCNSKEEISYNGIYEYKKEIEVENIKEPVNLWIAVTYENDKLIGIDGMGLTLPEDKSRLDKMENNSEYIPELNLLGILKAEKLDDETINYEVDVDIFKDSTDPTQSEFTDFVNVTSKSNYNLTDGEYVTNIKIEDKVNKSDFKFDRKK